MPEDTTPTEHHAADEQRATDARRDITRKLGEVLERYDRRVASSNELAKAFGDSLAARLELEAENARLRDENQRQAAELERRRVKPRGRRRRRSRP